MNGTGRRIREKYADTGGFTDFFFAVTTLPGYRFIPRNRDLPSKRLHVFNRKGVPTEPRGLIGSTIRENTISANWPDVRRSEDTMVSGAMPPSHLPRKFAAYPRQHDLAIALREIGRVKRTPFIIEWLPDIDMQRRASPGLNEGEGFHSLKSSSRIGRQGEFRDRTSEARHFRVASLNLLAAIIMHWNADHVGRAIRERKRGGFKTPEKLFG